MKKALLFLLSVGSFIASYAQPTIHAADVNPVIGDTIKLFFYNGAINTGQIYANALWDFSTLSTQYPTITSHYIAPDSTFNAALFPNANLCDYDSVHATCYYYYADSTRFSYIGTASSNSNHIDEIYLNPQATYRYPLTYNTHYTDSVSEIRVYQNGSSMDSAIIRGKADWNVVGYGTLILPSGTFNNVLKVVITDTQTIQRPPTPNLITRYFTETCWFYPGIHTPILDTYNGGTYYLAGTPTAVNEIVAKKYNVSCFPNPAQENINLRFELKQPGDVSVKVMAANGAVVLNQSEHYGQPGTVTIPLNVNQLPAGVYIADLNISGMHISQQFIKN